MSQIHTEDFVQLNKKGLTRFPLLKECYKVTYLFSFGIEACIQLTPLRVQIFLYDEIKKCDSVDIPRNDFIDLFNN